MQQKKLYDQLYTTWNAISDSLRETIVPGHSSGDKSLFKWSPSKIFSNPELDSVRRTNLNVMERMISSTSQQSDRTLGAMYTVRALTKISYRCRQAYPWLLD
jgi:hypothetical protein